MNRSYLNKLILPWQIQFDIECIQTSNYGLGLSISHLQYNFFQKKNGEEVKNATSSVPLHHYLKLTWHIPMNDLAAMATMKT